MSGSKDDKTQILTSRQSPDDRTVIHGPDGLPQGGLRNAPVGQVIGQGPPAGSRIVPPGGALRPGMPLPQPAPGPNVNAPGDTQFIPSVGTGLVPPPADFRPVVGWLAIVRGPNRGDCKPLYYGPNSIGRGEGHDVRLDNDQHVSRQVHGHIVYDDLRRKFIVRDHNANPIYFRGQLMIGHAEIANRDEITIGKTTMMFIALCDESFDWIADAEQAKSPQ